MALKRLVGLLKPYVSFLNTVVTLANELKSDYNLLLAGYLNRGLNSCGLGEGTNAATLKLTRALSYLIGGVLYYKAATDNVAMTTQAQQAVSTYCLYLVSIIADGTVAVTKGTEVSTDAAVLPSLPASSAPVGYIKIATDGSTTFTSGTTDLGAAGITETYQDLSAMTTSGVLATAVAAASLSTVRS